MTNLISLQSGPSMPVLAQQCESRNLFNDVLDLENPIAEPLRFEELVAAVVNHGLPWLQRVSTVEGAREYCMSRGSTTPWVTVDAQRLLGLRSA
jgi:hypothetical protein